jgi:cysteine desulfurase
MMVYLDNNATTALDPAVADKMAATLREHFGNPSSLYPIGRQGKEMINEAREHVARALGPITRPFSACSTHRPTSANS